MNNPKDYLGTGWQFPPMFSPKSKSVKLASAEADIRESLAILLSTGLGERVMQPTYGCDLQALMFETLSPTVVSSVEERIRTAILSHEPRIRLETIDLRLDDYHQGVVNITLDYRILSTNSRFSMVYPLYREEGATSV